MQELVPDIRGSDKLAAGLLIECRGQSAEALQVPCFTTVSYPTANTCLFSVGMVLWNIVLGPNKCWAGSVVKQCHLGIMDHCCALNTCPNGLSNHITP